MADKIEGFLEVGRNDEHEIVINLDPSTVAGFDATGGHIVFSSRQARRLANLLIKHAEYADAAVRNPIEQFHNSPTKRP